MARYFYKIRDKVFGPVDGTVLKERLTSGVVDKSSAYVRREDKATWIPAVKLCLSDDKAARSSSSSLSLPANWSGEAASTDSTRSAKKRSPDSGGSQDDNRTKVHLVEECEAEGKHPKSTDISQQEPPPDSIRSGAPKRNRAAPFTEKEQVPPIGMTRGQGWLVIILLLAGMGAPVFVLLKPTPKWEYKVMSPRDTDFEREMKAAGDEGWEVVAARRAKDSLDNWTYELILKRQKRGFY